MSEHVEAINKTLITSFKISMYLFALLISAIYLALSAFSWAA